MWEKFEAFRSCGNLAGLAEYFDGEDLPGNSEGMVSLPQVAEIDIPQSMDVTGKFLL